MNAHAHRVNILTNVSIIIWEGYKENTTIIPQMHDQTYFTPMLVIATFQYAK